MNSPALKYLPHASIGILLVLYGVGIVGTQTASREWFLDLTPMILAVSLGLLLLNHRDWRASFVLRAVLCMALGFGIEVLGVHTGWVFGEYAYGARLGLQAWGVPLIIGLNWLLLAYCCNSLGQRLPWSPAGRAAFAAALMTGLDGLIEYMAIVSDFWRWEGGCPPMQNFLAWFGFSLLLSLMFQVGGVRLRNPVSVPLLALQTIFFATFLIIRSIWNC